MNNIKLSFFLATKSLVRSNKSSLGLVIIIMMIVFLNLLFTDSIFAGIGKGITDGKRNYQYGELVVEPKTGDNYIAETRYIVDFIRDNRYVEKLAPLTELPVTFINNKRGDGVDSKSVAGLLVGINVTEADKEVFNIRSKIIDGRYLMGGDYGKIVIGAGLAGGYEGSLFTDDLEGIRAGDKLTIKLRGIYKEYEVIGIFKTKNANLDKQGLILDREMDWLLGTNDEASKIIVRITNKDKALEVANQLRSSRFKDYDISDWEEKAATGAGIEKSFEMIGSILRIIGSLVAGLVIFIIIFVDIVNKRRQIGILKAIGLKESIIINSYIIRGIFYTIVGSILGYLLMELIIINASERSPIDLPMGDIVPLLKDKSLMSSVIFFIVAGFIGSAVPAMKEIKKKILDLLYH